MSLINQSTFSNQIFYWRDYAGCECDAVIFVFVEREVSYTQSVIDGNGTYSNGIEYIPEWDRKTDRADYSCDLDNKASFYSFHEAMSRARQFVGIITINTNEDKPFDRDLEKRLEMPKIFLR